MGSNAKKKSELKSHLKDILNKIKIEDSKQNMEILEEALNVLIKEMKQTSPTFKTVFSRIYYTGSYYGGLRIKNATEFDLNLVLKFPLRNTDIKVTTRKSPSSFARCHIITKYAELQTRHNWSDIQQFLKDCFDLDNFGYYASPKKVKRWLIGIVDKVLSKGIHVNGISKISRAEHGPATTLYFTRSANPYVTIDVDLVPVLEFVWPCWPEGARKDFSKKIPEQDKYWFLVPKPVQPETCGKKQKVDQLWRLHFPGIENHLIYNTGCVNGCVKPVIKLLKLLRDTQGWNALYSYYLKTVVMLAIINDKSNSIDWGERNMDVIFLQMLKDLCNYLQEPPTLPHLFYRKVNLLNKLDNSHAYNIRCRLQRIIKSIEINPNNVHEFMQVSVANESDNYESQKCQIL